MTRLIFSKLDQSALRFVKLHGTKFDVVLEDTDEVRMQYPFLSGFPMVIVDAPAYYSEDLQETIPDRLEHLRKPEDWIQVEVWIDQLNRLAADYPPK